jgi:class 3 adenylate cyclase/tetratricopeptide (TPR) repeat protein
VPLRCLSCDKENPDEARFCLACGSSLEETPQPRESRKTVTLVFSDVVGSTSLGERSDPETTRRVMSRYFDEMRAVLESHGGTVEKFVGDAVMAVFGIPELHEDDAVRAVRAAAEMRDRLHELNRELVQRFGIGLAIRTGVNTGEVIAGDASRGEAFVTGDAVNVAARLEQAAVAGEILIGEATQRLVRDAVAVEPVEPLELKGKAEPVKAWRLLDVERQAPGVARRLDSRLIGRRRELGLLDEAVQRAEGERMCQLVTVLGSPGAGKSRLAGELIDSLTGRATVVQGPCLPYGEGITFWPVTEMVKGAAGIAEADGADEVRAKIALLLPEGDDRDLVVDRISSLLGATEGSGALQELFWAVRRLLEALARESPLVAVFDDIHWAEPSLLDLIEYVSGWSSGAPILLLCLARQDLLETRPSLAAPRPNASSILLEPLDSEQSGELIENLLSSTGLDPEVRRRIAEAAEGNPLYVEEIVRMLVDEGALRRQNGEWKGDPTELTIPPTIHALLAARLDRLEEEEREVLQRASVIGRVFWWGAVSELSPKSEQQRIPGYLQTLVRKELIRPDPGAFAGEDAFRFGHQLIRDAAYEGLSKQTRADLHEQFAAWIEDKAGERLAEYLEVVGYHLEQSWRYRSELGPAGDELRGLAQRAGEHIATAGRRALARGDVHAASNLLGRAASLLPDDHAERVPLLLKLADALRAAGDLRGATEHLEQASAAARNPQEQAHVLIDRLYFETLVEPEADLEQLMQAAKDAIPIFERSGDERGLTKVWRAVAEVHLTGCRWGQSSEALERALEHARRAGLPEEAVPVLTHLANALFWGPTPVDAGIDRCKAILAQADGHRIVEANILCYLGGFAAMKEEFDEARRLVSEGRAIFSDLGHRYGLASHTIIAGPLELLAGDAQAAERVLRQGYDIFEEMGETGVQSTMSALLAEAIYEQGKYEEAERQTAITERLAPADDVASQVAFRATKARLLARRGQYEAAENLAREAVRRVLETDFLDMQGNVLMALAEVLQLSGRQTDGAVPIRQALAVYEQKGNIVSATRARTALETPPADVALR